MDGGEWARRGCPAPDGPGGPETAADYKHEREEIVRELHDMVANRLTLILMQARRPEREEAEPCPPWSDVLATVESTARECLVDLRRMLTVLRAGQAMATLGDVAPLLDQIDQVVREVGWTGSAVRLRVRGRSYDPPVAVRLVVARVLRELLTNAARHAPASPVDVTVAFQEAEIRITVISQSSADMPAGGGSGTGLRGIAERVAELGGQLTVQPNVQNCFKAVVSVPVVRGGGAERASVMAGLSRAGVVLREIWRALS